MLQQRLAHQNLVTFRVSRLSFERPKGGANCIPYLCCLSRRWSSHSGCCTPAVYLVFGATGGIGSALSKLLQSQPDAKLILSGRTESKLKELSESIGGGTPMPADVLNPQEVCKLVRHPINPISSEGQSLTASLTTFMSEPFSWLQSQPCHWQGSTP